MFTASINTNLDRMFRVPKYSFEVKVFHSSKTTLPKVDYIVGFYFQSVVSCTMLFFIFLRMRNKHI